MKKLGRLGTLWAQVGQAQSLINPRFLIRKYRGAQLPNSKKRSYTCARTHTRASRAHTRIFLVGQVGQLGTMTTKPHKT